jgi:PAS domain S-box-containing protein
MSDTHETSAGDARFRRLVDALDHAIVWEFDDTAQRYRFVSEHSKLVLGYDCDAWMSDPTFLERRIVPEDVAKFAEVLSKLRSGEANDLRLEHRCTNADGSTIWVHTGIHREDENGCTLLRGVTIDINSIKTAEERERAAREQAEDAVNAYEEIMAIVSHDLRNPLNSILLGAESLELDSSNASKTAPLIARSAKRMARLIDDLMDLSSIRARRLTVTPTEVTTHALIREAMEGFASIAAEKGIELRASEGVLTTLHCDPKRIAQVLSNLLGNAVKFTPSGGTVTVSASVDDLEAHLSVGDNGPGIAPDHLSRVFERNWQARENASQGSSGLGLFISKGIVEAHAGRIWVESVLGQGATFHFTLPLP